MFAVLRARLAGDGRLRRNLTAGALAFTVCAYIFVHIAEDVATFDRITLLDLQVSQWFHLHASPSVTRLMLVITDMHSTLGIVALSSLLAIYWARIKAWKWLVSLILTVPFGMLLNEMLKFVFQRQRPTFDVPLLTLNSYSFPSGHTAAATLFYGVLAAWLICQTRSWGWRIATGALTSMIVGMVGLSRIYLGVHYVSDVLAAVAASGAWLALSLTVVAILRSPAHFATLKR